MTGTPLIGIPSVHPLVPLGQTSSLCAAPPMWKPCALDEINFRLACPMAALNPFPGAQRTVLGAKNSPLLLFLTEGSVYLCRRTDI